MKLLVNKANLTDLWARNYATIQYGFDFKICLQTQKSYQAFWETGPNSVIVAVFTFTICISEVLRVIQYN